MSLATRPVPPTRRRLLKRLRRRTAGFGLAVLAAGALGAPLTASAYDCPDGATGDERCGVIVRNGIALSFPKLEWTRLDDPRRADAGAPASELLDLATLPESNIPFLLADEPALALEAVPAEVVSAVQSMSTNAPFVFGRYDLFSKTLRIDLFRVSRVNDGGAARTGLFHAVFAPEHGRMWRANRSYLAPAEAAIGITPGLDPFAAFGPSGPGESDQLFHRLTPAAAQVVLGHAMRHLGTTNGFLAEASFEFDTEQTVSKRTFRQTTTTHVFAKLQTAWYVAQPTHLVGRQADAGVTGYCVTDPTATACPLYQTATSGVTFRRFQGGSIERPTPRVWLDSESQKGPRGFLKLAISLVFMGGGDPLLTYIARETSPDFILPENVLGLHPPQTPDVTAKIRAEDFNFLGEDRASLLAGASPLVPVNPAEFSTPAGVSSARSNSLSGEIPSDGGLEARALRKAEALVNAFTAAPLPAVPAEPMLEAVKDVVLGSCAAGAASADCAATGQSQGFLQRADQYQHRNVGRFLRDTTGEVVREID